jgi:hypothetical protein
MENQTKNIQKEIKESDLKLYDIVYTKMEGICEKLFGMYHVGIISEIIDGKIKVFHLHFDDEKNDENNEKKISKFNDGKICRMKHSNLNNFIRNELYKLEDKFSVSSDEKIKEKITNIENKEMVYDIKDNNCEINIFKIKYENLKRSTQACHLMDCIEKGTSDLISNLSKFQIVIEIDKIKKKEDSEFIGGYKEKQKKIISLCGDHIEIENEKQKHDKLYDKKIEENKNELVKVIVK